MAELVIHGFPELTKKKLRKFKSEVYKPLFPSILNLGSQMLHYWMPLDLSIFSTIDHEFPLDLLQKLNVFKSHYGTHDIVNSAAIDFEYQCFSRSVLSTPDNSRLYFRISQSWLLLDYHYPCQLQTAKGDFTMLS